jgi:outer membrane protein assembly factor BamA
VFFRHIQISVSRLSVISVLLFSACPLSARPDRDVIGNIRFIGLNRTKKSVVLHILENRVGEAYSEIRWISERDKLMDLDIFASVSIAADKTESGTELTYTFVELPSFILFPAMKRTDQDGLLMGPGIVFMNMLGLGIHQELMYRTTVAPDPFRAKEFLSWTKVRRSSGFPLESDLTLNLFNSYNTLKRYDERSLYSLLNLLSPSQGPLHGILSLSALSVKHDASAPCFTSGGRRYRMFHGKGGRDFLPSAGAGFIMDTRERLMNPHRGFYLEGRYSLYGKYLGGDGNFSEYLADLRGYAPLSARQILFFSALGRYRPGSVPAYEFFHAGGVNSLRTYEPDPERFSQHEALATVEYRFELFTRRPISLLDLNGYYGIQIVAGADYAALWKPEDRLSGAGSCYAVYGGIHLLVPALERVRIEFGLNSPDWQDKSVKIGFGIGWYEKSETQRYRVR